MITTAESGPASLAGLSVPGRGELTVTCAAGRSVVSRAYATSPLRLLTPANHGRAAWVYTSNHGGGLVDGDHLSLDVGVQAGAAAFLSTQSATKVYRSPRGTSLSMRATVAADGLLVAAPDPVVCFARSRYRQVQHFVLAERGALVAVDWLSSGRRAAGERWAFDEFESRMDVRLNGRWLVHDATALRAADGDLAPRLGRFEALALLIVAGVAVRAHAQSIATKVGLLPVQRRPDELSSVVALGEDGCLVRIAGTSLERVRARLMDLLAFVPPLLGDDPWSRKW